MHVRLLSETDLAGFRAQARRLVREGAAPDDVQWSSRPGTDLFDGSGHVDPEGIDAECAGPGAGAGIAVPSWFLPLCERVVLHSDAQRFALLYRLLWRLAHEPALRSDPLDADRLLAGQMAHAVGHDIHKMRAFLRFRPVADPDSPGETLHVAWFEPQHHIVEANAPWIVRRFAGMRWAVLTPERCAAWDGRELRFREGASRAEAPPADAGEELWLTYYRSIFNPARLKLATMQREMPRRYWHNLPEAALIGSLAAGAMQRAGTLVEAAPAKPQRRIRLLHATAPPVVGPVDVHTLDALHAAVSRCRNCPIGEAATQAVNGEGPEGAALMLVGEQPGDQEDLEGRPFVGPAGRLLDEAMSHAGIKRRDVFLSNAVKHFKYEPRGKRRIHKTPTQAEAAACSQWLEHEIALVRPGVLVALGATAARSLLGRPVAITRERGAWHQRADGRDVMVTWHPSALLRMPPEEQPAAFASLVADLRLAASRGR